MRNRYLDNNTILAYIAYRCPVKTVSYYDLYTIWTRTGICFHCIPLLKVLPGTRVVTIRLIHHTTSPSKGLRWWWRQPSSWLQSVIRGRFWARVLTLWCSGEISSVGWRIIYLLFLLNEPLGVSTSYDCGAISSPSVPHSLLSGIHTKSPGSVGNRSRALWR